MKLVARYICRAGRIGLLLLVGCGLGLEADGAEVLNVVVREQQGRYELHSEVLILAPAPEVRALLMDFENLPRINPDLKRVRVLDRKHDGEARLGIVAEFCLLACLDLNWVQDVRLQPGGDIAVAIEPNSGDFRQGNGHWRLLPAGTGTRLIYTVELTPNVWLPPVFGPWLMKRKMAVEAVETSRALERMAVPNPIPRAAAP
ncbi:type II toxin-antitoxin system RatA family toxin [Methylococcus sp. EFPC2]|uniref:type II toxin-antitoxin system RatA family toxin n=1 Tax=Methylococcus sp. EFPC2 TaxID=2812648 RepID=UPI0019671B7E|nr:SRPBCC family protein [Methylococcus sp. EFPC2]QSA96322.1 SRPBCC family protein [Methylococcus sp. EFPC2]